MQWVGYCNGIQPLPEPLRINICVNQICVVALSLVSDFVNDGVGIEIGVDRVDARPAHLRAFLVETGAGSVVVWVGLLNWRYLRLHQFEAEFVFLDLGVIIQIV
jgi:hypothetical protein